MAVLEQISPVLDMIGALQQMREQTQQRITQIRVDTEEVDKERRTLEEKNKKERANKIQNEVI